MLEIEEILYLIADMQDLVHPQDGLTDLIAASAGTQDESDELSEEMLDLVAAAQGEALAEAKTSKLIANRKQCLFGQRCQKQGD